MKIGETIRFEVATAGDPSGALVNAVSPYSHGPDGSAVLSVGMEHDDECPCVGSTKPMTACTCEIVGVRITRLPEPDDAHFVESLMAAQAATS